VSRARDYDRIGGARRRHAADDPLRHRPSPASSGFCEESCPVDSIVETRILEYHGEKRGDHYTKEMLLAVGDRYEAQIAKDREEDARYR
jgi:hypothetical protein